MASRTRKRQVQIVVDVQSKKAVGAIKRLGDTTDKGFRDMRRQIQSTFGPWSRLKSTITATGAAVPLVKDAFQLLTSAMRAFVNVSRQAVDLAGEQQRGIHQLSFALGRAGISYEAASDRIDRFIEGLEDTTTAGDETIRQMMAQFSLLSGGALDSLDEIERATTLVMDVVSTGVSRSARSVTMQIAQVYAGNVAGLRSLLSGQEERIREIGEISNVAERTAAALDLLRGTYEGARLAADQFDVQLSSTRSAFEEVLQQFGTALREGLADSGLFVTLTDQLRRLSRWVNENSESIVEFFEQWGNILRFVVEGIEGIIGRLRVLWQLFGPQLDIFADLGDAAGLLFEIRDAADEANASVRAMSSYEGWRTIEPVPMQGEETRGGGGGGGRPRDLSASALIWAEAMAEQKAAGQEIVGYFRELFGADSMTALAEEITTASTRLARDIGDALETAGLADELKRAMKPAGQSAGEAAGEGWVTGFSIATDALTGFASSLPKIMGDSAEDGAARVAAVFQFLGQAAQVAAAIGVAAKASTSWLGPLSQFFAMAAASASFAAAMGAGGGGGGQATAGARGAVGAEAADVLVGQRPEATRGGITRNISVNAGAIFNAGAETRRALVHEIRIAEGLNEFSRVPGL